MVTRWKFYDPVSTVTYEVPINPSEGGSPERRKKITYQNTSGPNGDTLIFEGKDAPKILEFTGTILEKEHLEAFETWFDKRYQIQITDDLSRVFSVYITDFIPRRVRSAAKPWKHSFSMRCTILDW